MHPVGSYYTNNSRGTVHKTLMKCGNFHATSCVSKCFAVLRELNNIYLTTLYISEFIWPQWSVNEIWVRITGGIVLTRKTLNLRRRICSFTTSDLTWTDPASNSGLRSWCLNPVKIKHAIYKHGNFNPCLGLDATGLRKLDFFFCWIKA
jgi:hypothetical protein